MTSPRVVRDDIDTGALVTERAPRASATASLWAGVIALALPVLEIMGAPSLEDFYPIDPISLGVVAKVLLWVLIGPYVWHRTGPLSQPARVIVRSFWYAHFILLCLLPLDLPVQWLYLGTELMPVVGAFVALDTGMELLIEKPKRNYLAWAFVYAWLACLPLLIFSNPIRAVDDESPLLYFAAAILPWAVPAAAELATSSASAAVQTRGPIPLPKISFERVFTVLTVLFALYSVYVANQTAEESREDRDRAQADQVVFTNKTSESFYSSSIKSEETLIIENFSRFPIAGVVVFSDSENGVLLGTLNSCASMTVPAKKVPGLDAANTYVQFIDAFGRDWIRGEGGPPEIDERESISFIGSDEPLAVVKQIPRCTPQ